MGCQKLIMHNGNVCGTALRRESPQILIMEDEFIVALDLCDMTAELGFAVAGPFATLAEGVQAIREHRPDAAILDVQLADGEVFPLADELMRMGVPLIFHSGHADSRALIERYPGACSATKPCSPDVITHYLRQATDGVEPAPAGPTLSSGPGYADAL